MRKKIIIPMTIALALSLSCTNIMAEKVATSDKSSQMTELKKNPPFLIMGKMPHMTKQVMQAWDKPEFNLDEEQKSRLLAVRKETLSKANELAMKITPMEQQVAEGIFAGKTPEELAPIVKQIADIKAEATMLHLRCIKQTTDILNDEQESFLKNM